MAERGTGRIVNVSSVIGETGNIGQANYAASKSGRFGLTKTLAREAALLLARAGKLTDPQGIGLTVNTITPGFVATEMLEHIPEKVMEKLLSQIPLGRLGKPEEVARVVHVLAAADQPLPGGRMVTGFSGRGTATPSPGCDGAVGGATARSPG